MTTSALEERLTLLEQEVRFLKQHLATGTREASPWWQEIYGVFANTPAFEQAMLLGQQYRAARDDQNPPAPDEAAHVPA